LNLFSYLSGYYYCVGIMVVSAVAAFLISLKYYGLHKELRIFTYYIALSIIQDMTVFFFLGRQWEKGPFYRVAGYFTNFFMLAEYSIFVLFILAFISSRKRKWVIWINSLVFFGVVLRIWIGMPAFLYSGELFLVESLFLILPCLLYFYELLMHVSPEPLKNDPSFWVVTGILFLNACSIPLLLTRHMLGKYSEAAYSLNYLLYAILFLLLNRAYRCKPATIGPEPGAKA
jgi:hypothetical protein